MRFISIFNFFNEEPEKETEKVLDNIVYDYNGQRHDVKNKMQELS